ncbi:hypothetical protein JYT16_01495 [Gemmatimonas aurantiaca]|nr:hypothetical protein [Gemmatimonas aurantiaca]
MAESSKRAATITSITPIAQEQPFQIRVKTDGTVVHGATIATPLSAETTESSEAQAFCIARLDAGAAWAIDEWIIGNELYKSYQDPVAACGGSYPYSITEVHMFLQVATAATITIATDIESVDNEFLPGCAVPGATIHLGAMTQLSFPQAGLYDVAIELDTAVVVNEPFFVGFFFSSAVDPNWHLSLVTDNVEKACRSFNIWDTAIGYIDLNDDVAVHQSVYSETDPCYNAEQNAEGCFDFDGVLILHTGGYISEQTGCCVVAGDANNDGRLSIGDVTFLIEMLFTGAVTPACNDAADANGDATITIGDVTHLIGAMFSGKALPVCGNTGT